MAVLSALPALDIKQPESPIDSYSKVLGVQNQIQQAKMNLIQQQTGQVQLDQAKKAQADQAALGQLMIKHAGNLDKVIADAPSAGVQPKTIIDLQQHNLEVKKNTLAYVSQAGAEAGRQADLMAGAHDAVVNAKPEDKAQAYQNQMFGLQKQGVDVSGMPAQYPGDDQFKMIGAFVQGHKQQVDDALKTSEIGKNTAQAGEASSRGKEADAQTKKIGMETDPNNPADANIAKAKYQGILQKLQQGGIMAVPPADFQWAQAHENEQRKTTQQSDSLGVTSVNTSGPSGIMSAIQASKRNPAPMNINPQGSNVSVTAGGVNAPLLGTPKIPAQSVKDSIVDMIGNYKYDAQSLGRLTAKHPEILAAVNQKYPDFDQTTYNAKNKMITSMTSGPQSRELNSINTAMGHVKVLDDAVDALNNGNVTLLNKIGTAYNINVAGKTPEAAFKLIVNRVGPEISSAYIPGGGGEKERIANQADFDVNLPPQTLHNNAAVTVQLLRSKIGALENQYKNTVGRDDFNQRFITPEAQKGLQKFAPQGSGGSSSVTSPNAGKEIHYKVVNGQLVAQ